MESETNQDESVFEMDENYKSFVKLKGIGQHGIDELHIAEYMHQNGEDHRTAFEELMLSKQAISAEYYQFHDSYDEGFWDDSKNDGIVRINRNDMRINKMKNEKNITHTETGYDKTVYESVIEKLKREVEFLKINVTARNVESLTNCVREKERTIISLQLRHDQEILKAEKRISELDDMLDQSRKRNNEKQLELVKLRRLVKKLDVKKTPIDIEIDKMRIDQIHQEAEEHQTPSIKADNAIDLDRRILDLDRREFELEKREYKLTDANTHPDRIAQILRDL